MSGGGFVQGGFVLRGLCLATLQMTALHGGSQLGTSPDMVQKNRTHVKNVNVII